MIKMEIYDEKATRQAADGSWPTKTICVSKSWLDTYARLETRYDSAEELLASYTLDEVEGIEAKARMASALISQKHETEDSFRN